MGTRYLFEKAIKICQNFSHRDRVLVRNRCRAIQDAQGNLVAAAETAMFHCIENCRGICCKNLDIDSIFSLWDFIFILTLAPQLKDEMQKRLDGHTDLYLSPCPFLKDAVGPCMFPDRIKAQICVITFCANDATLKKPIQIVNLNFYKLCWLIQYLRIKRIVQKTGHLFYRKKPTGQSDG
jgi:hypothetical protein